MRRSIALITVIVALCGVGCSTAPTPAERVREYMDLHRAGDIEGMTALHTEDCEFIIPGQEPIRGHAALRDLLAWDKVLRSELVMRKISAEGDTIFIDDIVERNDWFAALGVPEVHYRPGTRMVLREGRISGLYVSGFDEATEKLFVERFPGLIEWLSTQRPDELQGLLPGGKFRYDEASARLWLQVLADWNKERQ